MRFLGDVPPLANLSDLTRPEPDALLLELFGNVSSLEAKLAAQREEIARLKGLKGRPAIKPSGMDKGTEPPLPAGPVKRRCRGKVKPFAEVKDEVIRADIPPGSVFKGYEAFEAQDLVISSTAPHARPRGVCGRLRSPT